MRRLSEVRSYRNSSIESEVASSLRKHTGGVQRAGDGANRDRARRDLSAQGHGSGSFPDGTPEPEGIHMDEKRATAPPDRQATTVCSQSAERRLHGHLNFAASIPGRTSPIQTPSLVARSSASFATTSKSPDLAVSAWRTGPYSAGR